MKIAYENKNKLILEEPRRVSLIIGTLTFFVSAIPALYLISIFDSTNNAILAILVLLIYILTLFSINTLIESLYKKYDLKRKILVDRTFRVVRLQKTRKNRVTSENIYDFKSIKHIEVETDSYDHLFVRLVTDRRKVLLYDGYLEETKDHRNKLAIAHKLKEFIEVPVIEK